MVIFISLLIILLSLLFAFLKHRQSYWSRRGIPHDKPNIVMGNMGNWRKTKHFNDIFDPVYRKHKGTGPFAGFYGSIRPIVLALDIDFIKDVVIKDFNNFEDRFMFHNELDEPLTGNLFLINGEKWRPLRQKLTPTFTSVKMKGMFPTVLQIGEELSSVVAEKMSAADGGVLEMTDLLSRYAMDVIATCAFGLECNSLRNPNAEFCVMGRRIFYDRMHNSFVDNLIEGFPDLARKLRMRQYHPDCHKFYMRIVRETMEYRQKNNIRRNDYMDTLLDLKSKNELTFNELAAQACVFLVAGFETSANTLGFIVYELARNQDIQEKLRNEINEVLQRHNNEFTYEGMQEMHYMQQVMSETLRKYPVGTVLLRKAKAHYETNDPKYYIEKGTWIIIPVHAIHHDPAFYPEPDQFKPERFSKVEIDKQRSCSYLPFGEGPRGCIGERFSKMQVSIGIFFLIRNFKFRFCDRTNPTLDFAKNNTLLVAEGGIHLQVERI